MCTARILAFTFVFCTGDVLSADIFRCTGASGEPEFSQLPCAGDSTLLRIPATASTSSQTAGLRASEREWLATRKGGSKARKMRKRQKTSTPQRKSRDARARQCLKKRLALDKINAELRRGYKPARGERLRRRRREYRDYLSVLCS